MNVLLLRHFQRSGALLALIFVVAVSQSCAFTPPIIPAIVIETLDGISPAEGDQLQSEIRSTMEFEIAEGFVILFDLNTRLSPRDELLRACREKHADAAILIKLSRQQEFVVATAS